MDVQSKSGEGLDSTQLRLGRRSAAARPTTAFLMLAALASLLLLAQYLPQGTVGAQTVPDDSAEGAGFAAPQVRPAFEFNFVVQATGDVDPSEGNADCDVAMGEVSFREAEGLGRTFTARIERLVTLGDDAFFSGPIIASTFPARDPNNGGDSQTEFPLGDTIFVIARDSGTPGIGRDRIAFFSQPPGSASCRTVDFLQVHEMTTPINVGEITVVDVPEAAPTVPPTEVPTEIPTEVIPTEVPTEVIPTEVPSTQVPTVTVDGDGDDDGDDGDDNDGDDGDGDD